MTVYLLSAALAVVIIAFVFLAVLAFKLKLEAVRASARCDEDIENKFAVVQERIKYFVDEATKSHEDTLRMQDLADDMRRMMEDLGKTADALRGNNQIQGRHGEEILEDLLSSAGLDPWNPATGDGHYELQSGTQDARPDAQVRCANGQWFIVDSKMTLTNYLAYCEAADPKEKAAALKKHVEAVRGRIDDLRGKPYLKDMHAKYPGRDYLQVMGMFVGYEAPLLVALQADKTLLSYATQNNIVLLTPMSLMAYLRLVVLSWNQEKMLRNQEEMIRNAQELFDRTNKFLAIFQGIGTQIQALNKSYNEGAKVYLDRPNAQSIASSAHKLMKLTNAGAATGRKSKIAKCLASDEPTELLPELGQLQ